MLFLKHALATAAASAHACGTDSRTPGRSAEAGQTAELGPWIRETHPAARRLGSCARDSTGSARPPAQARGRLRARRSSRDGLLPEEDESGPFVVSCSPQPPTVLSLPGPSQGDPRAESTLRAGSSSPAPPARPGRPVGSRPSVPLAVGRLGRRPSPHVLCSVPSCTWAHPLPPREERGPGCGPGPERQAPVPPQVGGGVGVLARRSRRSGPGLGWGPAVRAGPRRSPPRPGGLALPPVSRVCTCIYVLVAFV